jgi:D-lactate dehydrogenase (cytochrome)
VKTLIATFNSVEEAGQAVSAIISKGLVPATLEMMDKNIITIIEDFAHAGLPTDAAALLLAEVDGYPDSLDAQVAEISQVLDELQARHVHICQTPEEREQIWFARKSAFGAMARISPAFFQVDGTVPRSRLAETLSAINNICSERELRVGYVFHAGDGNLHPLIPFDPANEEMEARVHEAGDEIMAICVAKGGTITGEHGVGIEKRKYMPLMYNQDELTAMHQIKEIFDPYSILNPGKIFPEEFYSRPIEPSVSEYPKQLAPELEPQDETQVSDILKVAQSHKQPVFIEKPGAYVQMPEGAAVLSTSKLSTIEKVSPDDLYVVAGAGMHLGDLQSELATCELWIPIVSPREAETTLGGVLSTAINSPLQMRYGSIRDQVLGLNVILPNGRKLRVGRPVIKNVAGYDMTKLFIGAYGTLGVITQVILKAAAKPRMRRSLVVPVEDLHEGIKLGSDLYRFSQVASSILLYAGSLAPELGSSPYQLHFTAEGYEEDVEAELVGVKSIVTGSETETTSGVELWQRSLEDGATYVRVGVSPGRLIDFTNRFSTNSKIPLIADLARGMVYLLTDAPEALRRSREIARPLGGYAVMMNPPKDFPLDPWGYIPNTLPLMHKLKVCWDPGGILNPGVFLV